MPTSTTKDNIFAVAELDDNLLRDECSTETTVAHGLHTND